MLFYRIDAKLLGEYVEVERSERQNQVEIIQSRTEMFFDEQGKDCHIAISNIMSKKGKISLCGASKKGPLHVKTAEGFAKMVDIAIGQIDIQEITLEAYYKMLQFSSRNDYVDNDEDICEDLGIAGLINRFGRRNPDLSETILSYTATKRELLLESEKLLCDISLQIEIDRIYQGTQKNSIPGHPVHYLIQSDEKEARDQILRLLLTALHQNGRIQSRRNMEIKLGHDHHISEGKLKALYESSTSGTIVVSFAEEDVEEGEYAYTGADSINEICAAIRQHRNQVLTVFCINRKAEKVKNVFLEHLGAITVVSITQETVFYDRAKAYLRTRAKSHGITADKSLYKTIQQGKGYTSADLNLIYDEWYDKMLKHKIYSQYALLDSANKQIAARKPKGSAIEELESMIGLTAAKKAIHQALDFYKAQKLFRVKGFAAERPSMHMVFTGNPGTAKTSVARLFAQIMKDNELLSVGDLYEVGRADLVGKYVGWTAKIVKAKFEAAKGSVLFIDEAYSLVEDRGGLFGDEAINTIVQEMENHREDMVVIFAGYPDKMEGFLQKKSWASFSYRISYSLC